MWAHDPYGRNEQQGGRLPTELVIYEDDPWYYHPRSGISQSDFYPRVCKSIFFFKTSWRFRSFWLTNGTSFNV